MSRYHVTITLAAAELAQLREQAAQERTLIATLAARYVVAGILMAGGAKSGASAVRALMDWLAPYVDEAREAGNWPSDITVSFFERIESEQLELYAAAAAEIGEATLNKQLGRFIRTRLEAEVVRRDGKPHLARVPTDRTKLVKTFTHLKP